MTDSLPDEKPESLDSAQPPKKRVTRKSSSRSSAETPSEAKPATRRRSTKKVATEAPAPVEATPVVSAQTTEEPAKPATRRRTVSKKASTKQEAPVVAPQATTETPHAGTEDESKPATKPKRTTTRRKKESPVEAPVEAVVSPAPEASSQDAPQAEKPRTRRVSKTSTKEAKASDQEPAGEATGVEQESQVVRKPRTTRTRKKADSVSPDAQTPSPEAPAVDPTPRPEPAPTPVEPTPVAEAGQGNASSTDTQNQENRGDANNDRPRNRQGQNDRDDRRNNRRFNDNDRNNRRNKQGRNNWRDNRNGDNRNGGNRNGGNNYNNQGNRNNASSRVRDLRQRKPNSQGQQGDETVEQGPPQDVEGLLEISPKGFGFLRTPNNDYAQDSNSVYVSAGLIRALSLRPAQWIQGLARSSAGGLQLTEIKSVNGMPWKDARVLPHFDELKAINPNKRIAFETTSNRYTTRVLDMMAPVGRGQRGLIVAPPRTGKTTFLQHMAEAVQEKYEDSLHLMILLIDERPEEVTEFKRNIKGAEIYASSNDSKARNHCRIAELCIERAKRLVEAGQHVFLLMDSITRLTRAYNNADSGSGRTMSGGIDARALEMPRRLFAAARNTRQAGSLTIIATALVETNSRMDDLIFQEFKGTGNMELVLNRRIAEQYIYPAVDILKSGTRREEMILPDIWIDKIHLIRRALAGHKPVEAIERLLFFLQKYPNNSQMLLDLKQRA